MSKDPGPSSFKSASLYEKKLLLLAHMEYADVDNKWKSVKASSRFSYFANRDSRSLNLQHKWLIDKGYSIVDGELIVPNDDEEVATKEKPGDCLLNNKYLNDEKKKPGATVSCANEEKNKKTAAMLSSANDENKKIPGGASLSTEQLLPKEKRGDCLLNNKYLNDEKKKPGANEEKNKKTAAMLSSANDENKKIPGGASLSAEQLLLKINEIIDSGEEKIVSGVRSEIAKLKLTVGGAVDKIFRENA